MSIMTVAGASEVDTRRALRHGPKLGYGVFEPKVGTAFNTSRRSLATGTTFSAVTFEVSTCCCAREQRELKLHIPIHASLNVKCLAPTLGSNSDVAAPTQ